MAFKLEENEYIVIFARRHWFMSVLRTMMVLFTLLIPIFLLSLAYAIPESSDVLGNTGLLSIIFLVAWVFIGWNAVFVIWTNHFLDVLVVTNLHIVDIEQIGLWNREISTLQIKNVQDISSKVVGLIASMLNYGDLEIQTAGNMNNFIVKGIQSPDLIRQKINSQIIVR